MCQDCHGDQGQGLDAAWRSTFAPESQDCWGSGCHGEDAQENSFILPETGAPALAGPGALPRFSTAFELGTYIHESMPFSLQAPFLKTRSGNFQPTSSISMIKATRS